MSSGQYSYVVFVLENAAFDLAHFCGALRESLSGAAVALELDGDELTLRDGGWRFEMHPAEEAVADLADFLGRNLDESDKEELLRANAAFDAYGDSDPDLERFAHVDTVVNELARIDGVLVYDKMAGSLIKPLRFIWPLE